MHDKEELMSRLRYVDDAIEWEETILDAEGREVPAFGRMVRIDPCRYGNWAGGYLSGFATGYECAETGELIEGAGSLVFLERDPAVTGPTVAGESLALELGASNWCYSDHVPPMQPGDVNLEVDNDGNHVTVILLEDGLSVRTVSTEAGEVLSVDVAAVPEGFGEMRFGLQ